MFAVQPLGTAPLQHVVLLKLGEFEQTVIVERAGVGGNGTTGLVVDVLPGGTLAILGALAVNDANNTSCGSDPIGGIACGFVSGLGAVVGAGAIVVGVASVALPLGIDLATGAFYQLEPAEVFVEFE